MALYTPGVAVGAIVGSIGRVVFSSSFAGPTMRINSGQLLTASAEAQLIKGNITALSKKWATLTPEQRSAWGAFVGCTTLGDGTPRKNPLNLPFKLPGNVAYIMVHQALKAAGITPATDDPPDTYHAGTPNAITPTWDPVGMTIDLMPATAPAVDEIPVIWATKALSPGRLKTKSHLLKLQVQAAGDAGPWHVTLAWTTKHGPFLPGTAITFMAQYTHSTDGAQGHSALVQQILTP